MTKQQFIDKYADELKKFIDSPCGRETFSILESLKPIHENNNTPHLYADNKGRVIGYELCLRNFVTISNLPRNAEEIEADYGVRNISQTSE